MMVCLIFICLVMILFFFFYVFKYEIVYFYGNIMYIFMCLMFFKLGENKEFFEIYGVILNIVYRFILIMLVLILNIRIILII